MEPIDLIHYYLEEINFKRPYEMVRRPGLVMITHRRDTYYLEVWVGSKHKLHSRILTYALVEICPLEDNQFIKTVHLTGVRTHGTIHDPDAV